MSSQVVTIRKIPKYERLQRMAARYPEFDPGRVEVLMTLMSVSAQVSESLQADLARYRISTGRFLILGLLLDRHPSSFTHSELAEHFGVTKGNITGLVDGLEREGYVKRGGKEGDRRVSSIILTNSGRKVIEKVMPAHVRKVTHLMRKLTVSEGKTLLALLAKVQAGLEGTD